MRLRVSFRARSLRIRRAEELVADVLGARIIAEDGTRHGGFRRLELLVEEIRNAGLIVRDAESGLRVDPRHHHAGRGSERLLGNVV